MAHKKYQPGSAADERIAEVQDAIEREVGIRPSNNEVADMLIDKGHLQWRINRHNKKASR